jgi:hypothetical protein
MVVVCCRGIKITINKATITMTIESAPPPPIIYGATTVAVCGVVPIPVPEFAQLLIFAREKSCFPLPWLLNEFAVP